MCRQESHSWIRAGLSAPPGPGTACRMASSTPDKQAHASVSLDHGLCLSHATATAACDGGSPVAAVPKQFGTRSGSRGLLSAACSFWWGCTIRTAPMDVPISVQVIVHCKHVTTEQHVHHCPCFKALAAHIQYTYI